MNFDEPVQELANSYPVALSGAFDALVDRLRDVSDEGFSGGWLHPV